MLKKNPKLEESGSSAPAQNDREQEAVKTEEGDTKKELLDKVRADFPGETLYYRMLEGKGRGNSLVVWNDSEDTVYLYLLKRMTGLLYR